ncbi:hypothetical protein QFZ54_003438 [Sphingomonas faeni]|nr:hypothetical protein [Sphingomonas faeni]MDQ0839654.1 hypothetical protein [Sphingomonas faeni]
MPFSIPRHADVREQRGDIGTLLELHQGVGRIAGFDDFVAGILQREVGMDPNQGIVVDDEYHGLGDSDHGGSNIRRAAPFRY